MRPTECKWCGASDALLRINGWRVFRCGANYHIDVGEWTHGDTCADTLRDRIQRAVDTLKNATRYRVTPVSRTEVEWDTSDDGPVTDSAAVDEALAILEGERDE